MTYPLLESESRTDGAFSKRTDKDHHHGPHPFIGVNIGVVTQFPLDYMHVVC